MYKGIIVSLVLLGCSTPSNNVRQETISPTYTSIPKAQPVEEPKPLVSSEPARPPPQVETSPEKPVERPARPKPDRLTEREIESLLDEAAAIPEKNPPGLSPVDQWKKEAAEAEVRKQQQFDACVALCKAQWCASGNTPAACDRCGLICYR